MMKMQYVHQYVDDSGDLTELFSVDCTERCKPLQARLSAVIIRKPDGIVAAALSIVL